MTRSTVYNRDQKGPWSCGLGPPVYHTIIQKSILVHLLWFTKNWEDQIKTNSAILTNRYIIK